MPHKTAILPFMDELTPAAKLAQAVNTVTYESGRLIGHTTDGIGYMHSVKDAGYDILGKNMTLLGAGGAATAICTQAALDGVKNIYMFKRKNASWKTAQDFADKVTRTTDCQVFLYDIADTYQLKQALSDSAILTNATNVGMASDISNSPVDRSLLYPELIVSDIIYNPRKTKLLQEAESIGCPTCNGLYMLLYQGAASFHCCLLYTSCFLVQFHLIAARQCGDKVVGMCCFRCLDDLFIGCIQSSVTDIFHDRSFEQPGVL